MAHFKDHTDNRITLTFSTCHCEPYFGNEENHLSCVNILLEVHGEQLGVSIPYVCNIDTSNNQRSSQNNIPTNKALVFDENLNTGKTMKRKPDVIMEQVHATVGTNPWKINSDLSNARRARGSKSTAGGNCTIWENSLEPAFFSCKRTILPLIPECRVIVLFNQLLIGTYLNVASSV